MYKFADQTAALDMGPVPALPEGSRSGQIEAMRLIWGWIQARLGRNSDKQDRPNHYKLPEKLRERGFDDICDDYFVLRGPAGTGKTFIMAELVLALSALGLKIAVGAPTNKAVGVIEEKVKQAAKGRVNAAVFKSVHGHVGLRMMETDEGETKVYQGEHSDLHTYDVAVFDEGSMLDSMHQMPGIQSARGECLILIVGDFCQIAPVGENDVSPASLLPQGYELTQIVRQAEGNPIIQAAWNVRAFMNLDNPDVGDQPIYVSDLQEWLPDSMIRGVPALNRKLLDLQLAGVDARGLAYRNTAVSNMNEYVHFEKFPDVGSQMFCVGERVVVQSQCRALNLDTGKTEDLITSEELIIMDVERTTHPDYPKIKVYQLVVQDCLGHDLMVYVPTLLSAFHHAVNEKFDEVREIKRQRDRRYDRSLNDRYNAALREAWGFKKAFGDIRLGYASTMHKIQGSTVDVSLVNLPDVMGMRSDFERNRSLYVGLTRPRNEVFFAY
jgi:exodeoxyribonuclease-5